MRLLSVPSGATVTWYDDGVPRAELLTPAEITVPRKLRGAVTLDVAAPGHRPLQVDLQRTEGRLLRYVGAALFQRGGREVTFVLEPDRAAIGSE